MPTFTAIALDRLIEPGASKSMSPVRSAPYSKLERTSSTSSSRLDGGTDAPRSKLERGVSLPPNPMPERRNKASTKGAAGRKHHWTQISPALYATPQSTPLPETPSSFPPSPYIINHKRRGPRLMKSFSEDDVSACQRTMDESRVDENVGNVDKDVRSVAEDKTSGSEEVTESVKDDNLPFSVSAAPREEHANGIFSVEHQSSDLDSASPEKNDLLKSVTFNLQQDGEVDDFFDPQDSMSVKSYSESEGVGVAERSLNSITPTAAEFYDAWEELSSESGPQSGPQPRLPDLEAELREVRLSLLMEIEKRKQTEEILNNMRNQWQRIREKISHVGITVPVDPATFPVDEQLGDPAEELCQQVTVARFISNSIGRATAKAEIETEMEAQLELKNFEIARLSDRLRYYEAVNREMSQRNQEAVETARRLRQRRKKKQRWVWGSIAAAITVGSAVLAYSYFQNGRGASSSSQSHAPEVDRGLKK